MRLLKVYNYPVPGEESDSRYGNPNGLTLPSDSDTLAISRNLTFRTERTDGFAKILPIHDEQVIEEDPVTAGPLFAQRDFHVFGRLCSYVTQQVGISVNVRVHSGSRLFQRHDDDQ